MKVNELPVWADEAKIEFKYAALMVKLCAKLDRFYPRWFAVQGEGDSRKVFCWNSRRVEIYENSYIEIVDQLRG